MDLEKGELSAFPTTLTQHTSLGHKDLPFAYDNEAHLTGSLQQNDHACIKSSYIKTEKSYLNASEGRGVMTSNVAIITLNY